MFGELKDAVPKHIHQVLKMNWKKTVLFFECQQIKKNASLCVHFIKNNTYPEHLCCRMFLPHLLSEKEEQYGIACTTAVCLPVAVLWLVIIQLYSIYNLFQFICIVLNNGRCQKYVNSSAHHVCFCCIKSNIH